MKKFYLPLLIGVFLFVSHTPFFGQTVDDFRTFQSGLWSDVNTWASWDGSSWVNPAPYTPTSGQQAITIRNTHTVTLAGSISIDQATVDAGGQITINTGVILTINDGAGTDLTVNGTIYQTGDLTCTATTCVFNNGSFLIHNNPGSGTVPLATYGTGSTIKVIGATSVNVPRIPTGTIHHLIWDSPGQTITASLFTNGNVTIGGDFTINSTGSGYIRLATSGSSRNLIITGNFIMNGGTFNIVGTTATPTFDVGGKVELNTGSTLNVSLGTGDPLFTVKGDWTNNGTFNSGDATNLVTLNGTSTQTIGGSASTAFSNLTIANTSASVIVNTNFSTPGNLTLNAGSILSPAAGVIISGAGTLTGSGKAMVSRTAATADFNNQYTITTKTLTNLTVEYAGTSTQNVNSYTYYNLTINNAAGVSVANDVSVSNIFAINSGVVTVAATKTISVTNTSTSAVTGLTSGADRYVNGRLLWSTVGGTYTFPVGYTGYGAQGLSITVNAGTGNLLGYLEPYDVVLVKSFAYCDLETHPGPPGTTINFGDGTIGTDSYQDQMSFNLNSPIQWNISNPGGGITNYGITVFSNGAMDISGVTTVGGTEAQFLMKDGEPGNAGVATGTPSPFTDNGFLACPNGTTLSALTSFSKFSLSGATKPNTKLGEAVSLPVSLISFDANQNEQNVNLEWKTATEINNDYFTLEKSSDGINFALLDTINGSGTSSTLLSYYFLDGNPLPGVSYYRLKQTDFNGQTNILKTVSVNFEGLEIISTYPNPADNNVKFLVNTSEDLFATFSIYDINGSVVKSERKLFSEGVTNLEIDITSLAQSLYVFKIVSDDNRFFARKHFLKTDKK